MADSRMMLKAFETRAPLVSKELPRFGDISVIVLALIEAAKIDPSYWKAAEPTRALIGRWMLRLGAVLPDDPEVHTTYEELAALLTLKEIPEDTRVTPLPRRPRRRRPGR